MADTIGDLIDKLTISNIKLWHIEDDRREYTASEEKNENKARTYLNLVSNVNKERNLLIDQINASLRILLDRMMDKSSTFIVPLDDLLGNGKNKFYKENE